ncbi:MAG: VOC family protein [Dehalococcoidia bacterium]|nr:VOC family protein [Dehalococcoidia bacterium]
MWLRVRQIAFIVTDADAVAKQLHDVFGLEVAYIDDHLPGAFGLQNRLLPVGTQFIELCAPIRENTAGGRYLERRGGDGGYMVICQCDDHAPRKQRVKDLGIRVVTARDTDVSNLMQLHPADTGGSFLEIDWHSGADDQFPGWSHAIRGPWHEHIRTDRVSAISGVEIQSADPANLAARWSEIIEAPLSDGPEGPVMQVHNATIRFVPATDGRPEGLGGIDLVATDAAAAKDAARAHGLLRDDGVIMIGGMRIRLV